MASYEDWLQVFQQAYSSPHRVSELACPNCGAHELQLRFVIYGRRAHRANAVFWCGRCLEGMPPGPSEVPAGCAPVRSEDVSVPDYRIVRPIGRGEGTRQS
jgi:hypothetical protein